MVRIGITTSFSDGEQQLRVDYVRAVEQAGGLPLLLPMLETKDAYDEITSLLNGLIITGGPAITDGLVGSLPDDLNETPALRSRSDRALLEAWLPTGKPLVGICYGMQLINAAYGGTIYADAERQHPGAHVHSEKRGATTHSVRIEQTSSLFNILNVSNTTVNSRHVQAIATLGPGLRASAVAPDGIIEAIEDESGTVLGLQFHPERMDAPMHRIFRFLVRQAQHDPVLNRLLPQHSALPEPTP